MTKICQSPAHLERWRISILRLSATVCSVHWQLSSIYKISNRSSQLYRRRNAEPQSGRITSEFHLRIEFRKRPRRCPLFHLILYRCLLRTWQGTFSLSTYFRSACFNTCFVAGGFSTTEGDSSSGNIRAEEQGYGCARYSKYIYVYRTSLVLQSVFR
jgi:hypothetical protein